MPDVVEGSAIQWSEEWVPEGHLRPEGPEFGHPLRANKVLPQARGLKIRWRPWSKVYSQLVNGAPGRQGSGSAGSRPECDMWDVRRGPTSSAADQASANRVKDLDQ